MTQIKLFRVLTSVLGSRSSSLLRRPWIPIILLLLHTHALLTFTTSLRVTRWARDSHILLEVVARNVVLCGSSLLMFRECLWCEILGSVWKLSRFFFECWGGHVRIRRCGFATPHINVGEEDGAVVVLLGGEGFSEKKYQKLLKRCQENNWSPPLWLGYLCDSTSLHLGKMLCWPWGNGYGNGEGCPSENLN